MILYYFIWVKKIKNYSNLILFIETLSNLSKIVCQKKKIIFLLKTSFFFIEHILEIILCISIVILVSFFGW